MRPGTVKLPSVHPRFSGCQKPSGKERNDDKTDKDASEIPLLRYAMTTQVTAKCSHCGFPLSPSHIGPCPKCGKIGKIVVANFVESLNLSAVVNRSGNALFASRNITTPEWWPEAAKAITQDVTKMLDSKIPELLDQHDRAVEAEHKRLTSRAKTIGLTLIWIVVGAILDRVIGLLLAH